MTTARVLTDPPEIVIDVQTGDRILQRRLATDLGYLDAELMAWANATRQRGVILSPGNTTILEIQPGLIYDGASIPALVQPIIGKKELYEIASAHHDELYHLQAPRGPADRAFWTIARSGSRFVTPARGWMGWAGLRTFGWYAYWRDGREARA